MNTGRWNGYLNIHQRDKEMRNLRSSHMVIDACFDHWNALYVNWVQIAIDEINLEYIWNQYIERTTR